MNKNTKIIFGVGVAVLVMLVIFAIVQGTSKKDGQPAGQVTQDKVTFPKPITATSTITTTTTTATPVKKPVAVKPGVVTPKQELDYNATVKKYDASGYRMQFISCGARPGSMTVKKGVSFMLDNRDNKAHTIAVGKVIYKLSAYGWKVISVSTVGKYNITCDGGGSGFITVQA